MTFVGKNIVFADFETYFSSPDGYGLRELSVTEFIRNSRFKAHGLAWRCDQWANKETIWVPGAKLAMVLSDIDWSNTVIVAHNIRFDGAILAWRYGVRPYAWFDTIALAKAVLGENVSGYSLASLAAYLGLESKGELKCDGIRDLTPQREDELSEYCKNDVNICRGIYEKLAPQFPQSQLGPVDWTIRAFVEPRLILDAECLRQGVETEKARREAVIKASGVEKSVLASNKQFAELLAGRGYSVPTKTSGRTGKQIPAFARTDDGLAELFHTCPELYHARVASKANLLETRGESLLAVAKTGSFPFDVGFSGAVQTHRYSGASGAGGNPQNFTRKSFLRQAVCPPPGHSLIVGDFAAVELRILAWLAKEPKLINKIVNDEDLYADYATGFYGRPITKADIFERQFGKICVLGLGYGMGGEKLQRTVKQQLKQDITEGAAYNAVKFYRTTYFNVPKLWEACNSLLPLIAEGRIGCLYFAPFLKVRKGAIILPSGLAIQYPNLRRVGDEWVYDIYRKKYEAEPTKLYGGKLVENICQAIAGELCKEAIARIESARIRCVGAVHDEILAVVPECEAAALTHVFKKLMEQAPAWWPALRLKSEVGYGKNWNEAKH